MSKYIISADLGQVNDYTAITIFENILSDSTGAEYHLRHIERPERGTPYEKQTLFNARTVILTWTSRPRKGLLWLWASLAT